MFQTLSIGIMLMLFSIIPLLFFLYALATLERLGISIRHPRVIVELLFFVSLLIVGLYLWTTI